MPPEPPGAPPPGSSVAVGDAAGNETGDGSTSLRRTLGLRDATLLTVGSIIGTGIFLVGADVAKALPHGGLQLGVWLVGGLLALAGALTFAELGAMFPRAGGVYHFLKEAYGPVWGYLYGWCCFSVFMSGGIAAIAIGFAEYLGAFVPWSSSANVLASAEIGGYAWTLTGAQIAGVGAILFLTGVNHFGVREGTFVQSVLSVLRIGTLAVLGAAGLAVAARTAIGLTAPLPEPAAFGGGSLFAGFGIAMIAVLWTYDGWYGLTFSAGETKDPARTLPLGLAGGTAIVAALYLLVNAVYLRALPHDELVASPRVGEAATAALFGPTAGRWLAAAVVLSSFGCLAATILYSSRIYQPMAADGLFFRSLAAIDPVRRVPLRALWAQSLWSVVLTLSGGYNQLYTLAIFSGLVFHLAAGAAIFVLRRRRPDAPRPYRVHGYPFVPLLFLVATGVLVVNTLFERPVEALAGLGLVALGLPLYLGLRRSTAR